MLRNTICEFDEIFVIFVALVRSSSRPVLRGVFDELFVEFAYMLEVHMSPEHENRANIRQHSLTFIIKPYFPGNLIVFSFKVHKL